MKELKEIRDDQIRIIGEGGSKNPLPRSVWIIILSILGIALVGVILLFVTRQKEEEIQELEALEPIHSRNIIKLQITDNHTQFGIHSKSKSF